MVSAGARAGAAAGHQGGANAAFPAPRRLQTLSGMSASDELDDSQVRQMLFDLESAYNAFNRFLHS